MPLSVRRTAQSENTCVHSQRAGCQLGRLDENLTYHLRITRGWRARRSVRVLEKARIDGHMHRHRTSGAQNAVKIGEVNPFN